MARSTACFALGVLLGGARCCDAGGLCDASGFVQVTGHVARSQAGTGRASLLASMATGAGSAGPNFDCGRYPELCKEPFNCQLPYGSEVLGWLVTGIGRANPRAWCQAPKYHLYAGECLGQQRDLVKAGQHQYERTIAGDFGPYTKDLDGSYCFIEGFCVDREVTNETTLAEAEVLCDRRFGPDRWRSMFSPRFRFKDSMAAIRYYDEGRNGMNSTQQTTPFLIAACAMGNFHCDVMYCKETYCKQDYYKEKYGHLLGQNGWA